MFLSNILSVYSLPLFFYFSIWKVLGNKKSLNKSSKKLICLRRKTKRSLAFSAAAERKINNARFTHSCRSMHQFTLLFTRVGIIFSRNENVKTRTTIFFRKRKHESRRVALVALMIQQWTIGPVDREIVPLLAEMDHPT
jgi:hypothetical protein